jgi:FkbM family methyltransferase
MFDLDPVVTFQKLPRFLRRHKLLRLLAWPGGPVHRVRVNDAFDAFIDVRDGFARLVAIDEAFETEFFGLAEVLLESDGRKVFFDVGANFGLMALGLGASLGGRLEAHLFEANPHLCGIIERSLSVNSGPQFHLVRGAVMAEPGFYQLAFELGHTGAGHVSRDGGVMVDGLTLDDYLEEKRIDCVDLLKIDVEGNETAVLQGARRALAEQRIKAIYFEYCPQHIERAGSPVDPVTLLRESGWEVFYCRNFDLAAGSSHVVKGDKRRAHLMELMNPPQIAITDLVALPKGRASRSAL